MNVRTVLLVLLAAVPCPHAAAAQRWFSIGPDSAPVSGFAGSFWNPHVLYAGTDAAMAVLVQ